ncbi:MAG: DUF5906 domain-containing protein [Halanaerobiales bacterium]
MEALKEIGYSIYRLKEAKESDEFLLYEYKTKLYNCYSKKRIFDIFKKLLDESNFDFSKFAEILDLKKINKDKVVNFLIEDNYIIIDNIGYEPSGRELIQEDTKILFNTYKKSKLFSNFKPNEDLDFPNIRNLLYNLVDYRENEYQYFCQWLAWQLQNPTIKLATSIILQGEQGTGKTQFCNLVLKNLFGNNFIEIGQSQINSEFTDYLMGKQLIVANEVVHNDNKFTIPEKLKNFVTDEYITIRRKFKNDLTIRNYSHFIFTSNHQITIKIEEGDRRYSVFKSKKLQNGWELIGNLKANISEELTAFAYHLFCLDVDYGIVDKPLENEHKKAIQNACRNNVLEFLSEIEELEGYDNLASSLKVNLDLSIYETGFNSVIKLSEFYKLYCYFCESSRLKIYSRNNFTRYLSNTGKITKVAWIDGKPQRVLILGGEQ